MIVLGKAKTRGNSDVITSHPINGTTKIAAGKPAYIDSDGYIAAATTQAPDGIAGQLNPDKKTQALIRCGLDVGVRIANGLTVAIGEAVYITSAGALTNVSTENTLLNAKFSSVADSAYDIETLAELAAATSKAATISFAGGL